MLTQAEYARHRRTLGLPGGSAQAVSRAIKDGRLKRSVTPDRRIVNADAADDEWKATTKAEMAPLTGPTAPTGQETDQNVGNSGPPPVNDLAAARTRREQAVAELAEIELAEKRGSLLEARDVEARLADVFLRCRTRILGVTPRLREQDPTLTASQLQLVETLLVEALEELAGTGPE